MTTDGWRNRIVGEGEKRASEFVQNPHNWRAHPRGQRQAMAAALGEVGWVQRVGKPAAPLVELGGGYPCWRILTLTKNDGVLVSRS